MYEGNWQTCTFAGNTGHDMNLSNTADVWIGVGSAPNTATSITAYDVMIIMNVNGPAPASVKRQLSVAG
jgi:hypothetical protein